MILSDELLRQWVTENVLTAPEAGEYLGITRSGVWKAVRSGTLPCIREKLFLKSDLDQYASTVKTGRPKKE